MHITDFVFLILLKMSARKSMQMFETVAYHKSIILKILLILSPDFSYTSNSAADMSSHGTGDNPV